MNSNKSFIILGGAELPWIYPLGVALCQFGKTTIIRLGASTSFFPPKVEWPFNNKPERLTRLSWNYPPGFNGKLSYFFTPLIRSRVKNLIQSHVELTGDYPFIITPYPKFFPYLERANTQRLIYWNYDDLSVEKSEEGRSYLSEEDRLVLKAKVIFCCSKNQMECFHNRFQEKQNQIFHLPHGVHELFIDPIPSRTAYRNTVCVVGCLSARYDWQLIHKVVTRLSTIKFRFVGNIERKRKAEWADYMEKVLALNNVEHITGLFHRETPPYFWSSQVNWMPYNTHLQFVRASCPLKLMDGIASGRSVISADVPECSLYPDWVKIYRTADEAIVLILEALSADLKSNREAQVQFALENTWSVRINKMVSILNHVIDNS